MIEIIREENQDVSEHGGRRTLPKDIKQIGRPDIGDRIYVENQAYRLLHCFDSDQERRAYVLLGRFENLTGRQCTFVEAVIQLEEIDFDGDLPLWSDHTWAYLYKKLKNEHDSMVIVGWAMDIKGKLPNMTARLEALHQKNFGGNHQILFLMDTLESDETFYGNRDGHLYKREGFYIYYGSGIPVDLNQPLHKRNEKNIEIPGRPPVMESEFVTQDEPEWNIWTEQEMVSGTEEETEQETGQKVERRQRRETAFEMEALMGDTSGVYDISKMQNRKADESFHRRRTDVYRGNYRRQIMKKEERQQAPSYATSLALLAIVGILGVSAFQNYQKMNAMEETLAQMHTGADFTETVYTAQKEEGQQGEVKVESVAGEVSQQGGQIAEEGKGADETLKTEQQEKTEEQAMSSEVTEGAGQTVNTENAGIEEAAAGQQNASVQDTAPTETAEGNEADAASAHTMKEGQTYLAQGYYVVQKGDSLMGICQKVYQTTAMMDKLCEVNGIEDQNAIYTGQHLILPN